MTELERMLTDSAERLFAGIVSQADIERMEHGQWPVKIWDTIEQSGLTRLFVSEAEAGASATWEEGLPLMLAAPRPPLPVAFIHTDFYAALPRRPGRAVAHATA